MQLRIRLEQHQDREAIAEVLRLFFAKVNMTEENLVVESKEKLSESDAALECCSRVELQEDRGGVIKTESENPMYRVRTTCVQANIELENLVLKKHVRKELKRQTYCLCEQITKMRFPWGSLTGVRPTQVALQIYQTEQQSYEQAKNQLIKTWRLLPEKAELGLETALAEEAVLKRIKTPWMVYIGIPFCPSRCSYCSFIAQDASQHKQRLDEYVTTLIVEIKTFFAEFPTAVAAVYLGGGTPTSISDASFATLLDAIRKYIPMELGAEITVEAGRPDTINEAKLNAMRKHQIDRICINPQTMHDQTLKLIGRGHNIEETKHAYFLAREMGFSYINMDLIAGLPGETPEMFLESVHQILDFNPESITLHAMALKRSSRFRLSHGDDILDLRFPTEKSVQVFQQAQNLLRKNNFKPYYLYRQKNVYGGLENIGFSKKGQESLYNVGMMGDQINIIGFGSGSMSKKITGDKVERCANTKDILDYLNRIDELLLKKIKFFN